ncbi:MAG TPA: alpha/beta fold hydrolase, partial [Baekduia sp.]|nr:alpha/beta fold hydrolase [Baekduia sp.]
YRATEATGLEPLAGALRPLDRPALVVWGAHDPYVPATLARDYAGALGGPAQVRVVQDAGHWPWWDEPALVPEITNFMRATV